MEGKNIIRLAVGDEAKRVLDQIKRTYGLPYIVTATQLFLWFFDQNEEVQRAILGLIGPKATADLQALVATFRRTEGGLDVDIDQVVDEAHLRGGQPAAKGRRRGKHSA